MNSYLTINALSEGIYKDKGSKFLSFVHPVQSVDEVKDIVKEYRKKYYDARHVCYAYMIGCERTEFRANDDGEPSGTAGKPILGQLNSNNLTDVLVVVIRYFGGILLGTSGLIHAYKEATMDALANTEIVEKQIYVSYQLKFEYPVMNQVMRFVKEENVSILSNQYESDCLMTVTVPKVNSERFFSKIKNTEQVQISLC